MADGRFRSRQVAASAWRLLIGRPLRARELSAEEITPVEGLSALSLDALTSVAYGPQAILVVLAAAGAGALGLVLPVTVAIVALLALLVVSYRQVIDAHPEGGGAYAVSRANLGSRLSLVAAASLVVDYTLTVAVSIAAGVGSLTSAFPSLAGLSVPICLGILAVITLLNLRGLGDSARAFLLPTAIFVGGLLAVVFVGLIHPLGLGQAQPGRSLVPSHSLEAIGVLLVLRAFAAGLTALTGVEAIANGVPLFRPPKQARAKRTELMLGVLLGAMLLGLAVLAQRWGIGPRSGQTVLSQVMADAVGRQWAYYLISVTVTLVLALAANTSFGGLPVLASLLARDNYLPHLFSMRGDRQVFNNGIWALAILAGSLLAASSGNTDSLIPLFAIGVFTGFTLAQAGLVVHWRRLRPPGWQRRAAVNAVGAAATGVATVILLVTKFTEGAWVVVVAIPVFLVLFVRIHAYYARAGRALGFGRVPGKPRARSTLVVVPVSRISRVTRHAISEALSISKNVVAVSVVLDDPDQGDPRAHELVEGWARWNPGVPLTILRTEYASVAAPIVAFIDEIGRRHHEQIVVLIPVVVPAQLRYQLLHNHVDLVLTAALRGRSDVVVARVPMSLEAADAETD